MIRLLVATAALVALVVGAGHVVADEATNRFRRDIEPILTRHCFDCHGGGEKSGGVAFDRPDVSNLASDTDLWWKALKHLRAELMPPHGEARPSPADIKRIEAWVKEAVFKLDANDPDPGRVTVRRLNRTEYRNTIRDLLGVDFDAEAAFPADDSGHGFDNIGDVLTLSPLLLEKYIDAAKAIITRSVPRVPRAAAETTIAGSRFRSGAAGPPSQGGFGGLSLSYYKPASVSAVFHAKHQGRYQLLLDLGERERFVEGVFDYNRCRLTFAVDGKELHRMDCRWQGGKTFRYEFDREWAAVDHKLTVELTPLTPNEKQNRSLEMRFNALTIRGPMASEHWVRPKNFDRFFTGDAPARADERREYAGNLLRRFATKAFRRPVDEASVARLAALAERTYNQPGQTFEAGVADAMTAVLASPRFLFREEDVASSADGRHPIVDEYALASRLSYFFWSTMPDEELFRLAGENRLRQNLKPQVERMLRDPRSNELIRHFVGQWLQARGVDNVNINAFAVVSRDRAPDPEGERRRNRFRELRNKDPAKLTEAEKKESEELRGTFFRSFGRFRQFELNGELRRAMRRETEMAFEHVLRKDRSVLELLDCDYTFLNERLARHYGIPNVTGDAMRWVKLPADSPRGGVLTHGAVLTVTSNPDRTSPVKRGLFILDNILGTPPAPPLPNIPALEDAKSPKGRNATVREMMAIHRSDARCNSCHSRMDPLGLALEHFNALGMFREKERSQPIDASGKLITGEPFSSVRDVKRILVTKRRLDFYRCLTEKMLTYALGRGLDYRDVGTVDSIVDRLEASGGRPSNLISGIIESASFQKRRRTVGGEQLGLRRTGFQPVPQTNGATL